MKWLFSFLFFFVALSPVFAQEFNAGIVQGLWYDDETVFAEKTVRIYVAIRNNTDNDLTGTVEFFDNDKRIGRKSISALDGRIVESWTDWTPSAGKHTISATLSRTKLHAVGENSETVTVTATLAKDVLTVDYDTDDDGIGNIEDTDDDGDGISDVIEEQNGTNPLVFNKPEPKPVEDVSSDSLKDKPEDDNTEVTTSNSGNPEGIEQFLTPSRAENMLGGITQIVNQTKENLDTYRQNRTVENSTVEPTIEEIDVNEDGFGEIIRTTELPESQKERPKAEKPSGFFGDIVSFTGTIVSGIYTGLLAALSFYLGHPVLVQLTLLLLILFLLYKIARRVGRRPQ